MKRCRFCAEEIQDAAIVCKHCGRDLIPSRVAGVAPIAAAPIAISTRVTPATKTPTTNVLIAVAAAGIAVAVVWPSLLAPIVTVAVISLLVWLVMRGQGAAGAKAGWYCQNCGTVGMPKVRVKGSFLIELLLWFCFLVPGLIYSLWRLASKEHVCPTCGAPNMIPVDSPNARAAQAATKHVA